MSNRGRYIVEAIVVEHRSPSELARTHKVSRGWIYKLLERFEQGGYASLEPRSRRPRSCSHQVEAKVQKLILKLRRELAAAGHDAGPQTIHFHLSKKLTEPPSVATIWRILKTPRPSHASASETAQVFLHPLCRQAAQRNLAGRRHALDAGRRQSGRDPELPRRLLSSRTRLRLLSHR